MADTPDTRTRLDNNVEEQVHAAAEARQSPSAKIVFETIRHEGEEELQRHSMQLAWSGLAAGLAMGFSFLSKGLLAYHLPDTGWAHIIATFGYSLGFLIVVLGRQQLYTENPLVAVLPVLYSRKLGVLMNMLRLWGVVLVTNIIGTFIFAWVIASSDLLTLSEHEKFKKLSGELYVDDFNTSFLGAIFSGWLIALMVWLLPFAETARVVIIILLSYIIGLAGFPHVIAGAVEGFYGVFMDAATWGDFLLKFFVPALLGNTIGGMILVAALSYGQVAPHGPNSESR